MNIDSLNLFCDYQKQWISGAANFELWKKSRRIGATWCHAFRSVSRRIHGLGNYYHSSADLTASIEFIQECETWAHMFNAVAKVTDGREVIDDDEINTLVMTFSNGFKIVAGSSNPKFFRSKGGEVGFDEFDFHQDQRGLFKAGHATAMFWGYPMRIWSSVNDQGTFMDVLEQKIERGELAGRLQTTTVLDAVAQGIVERIRMRREKLDHVPAPDPIARQEWLDELRSTCPDQETWDQEYLCIRSGDTSALLSYDLMQPCEVANLVISDQPSATSQGPLYAGFDVGRKKDLSVLWVIERVGDVFWTRTLRVFDQVNFTAQEGALNQVMSLPGAGVRRLCIDSTGIGMQMAERLQERFGKYRVEAVHFTAPVKSELAMPLRRLFEDKLIRIPMDDKVREDLHQIRKVTTAAGNVRFDADPGSTGGDSHADRFWALALAYHAAEDNKRPLPTPLLTKPAGW